MRDSLLLFITQTLHLLMLLLLPAASQRFVGRTARVASDTLGGSQSGGQTTLVYYDVRDYTGSELGARLNAAINAASAGQTIDMSGIAENQTFTSQITINKSINIVGCRVTLTASMTDSGQSSGAILITADHVTVSGAGQGQCIITQANAANIQNLIQTGSHSNITVTNLTLNGNEANQTIRAGKYYSCWAAETGSGGGHDLYLIGVELTGCGDRGTDWRGVRRVHLEQNYCHDTGVNIARGGSTTHGDCLHVGTDGFTSGSSDVWIVNNEIDKWGDAALACVESTDCHIIGNTLRGQADFGIMPNSFQGGLDTSGSSHVEITNNTIYNVPNQLATNFCENLGSGHIQNAQHYTIVNNHVYEDAASVLSGSPAWQLGGAALNCTTSDYVFAGNTLYNASLAINGIDDFTVTGNTFHFSASSRNTDVIDVAQSGGPVARNFTIADNSIAVDSGATHPTVGINFAASVTSPGSCMLVNNTITSNIAAHNHVAWQIGSAGAKACSPANP